MKTSIWTDCYNESLKAIITPEAFAHPAKMARRLCERIFDHGAACGYWQPGDLIVDPFGGIGTTGLIGAYRGYQVISVELEPRFVEMHDANIGRNAAKIRRLGNPLPIVLQGDSRRLSDVVIRVAGAISSPPYSESNQDYQDGWKYIDPDKTKGAHMSSNQAARYGDADGQIGVLREGDFTNVVGAVTSPPWEDNLSNDRVDPSERVKLARKMGISNAEHISAIDMARIGKRKYGYVDGTVTSPPWEDGAAPPIGAERTRESSSPSQHGGPGPRYIGYKGTAGQIGAERGETYWQAMTRVYSELINVLRTGGVAAIVVKDFVRNRERVPLCDRTAQLLEAVGFTIIERTHAMLVKETHAGVDMFSGESVTKRVERKSFFRRLAEKNGSPRIDYEEVIWARKSI